MTRTELFNKMWWSDQVEWQIRQKQCEGCKGKVCRSPFKGYVLEMQYSKDSQRTKIFNVPCKYHDQTQSMEHSPLTNISIYDK